MNKGSTHIQTQISSDRKRDNTDNNKNKALKRKRWAQENKIEIY